MNGILSTSRSRVTFFPVKVDTDKIPQRQWIAKWQKDAKTTNTASDDEALLPDSILLSRHDARVEDKGLALQYTKGNTKPRMYGKEGDRIQGKPMVRPDALIHGVVTVHQACNATGCPENFSTGTNALVASTEDLRILHYRRVETRAKLGGQVFKGGAEEEEFVDIHSLEWAHQLLSSELTV